MKLITFNKRYKTNLEDGNWDNRLDVSTSDQLQFCCGIKEVEINNLNYIGRSYVNGWTFEKLRDYLNVIASYEAEGNRSGVLLTDNNKDGEIHKLLSRIIKPIYMGINVSHNTKIYLWAIPLRKLK